MGHYVSVRGWIECEKEHLVIIEEVINKYKANFIKYSIEKFTDPIRWDGKFQIFFKLDNLFIL